MNEQELAPKGIILREVEACVLAGRRWSHYSGHGPLFYEVCFRGQNFAAFPGRGGSRRDRD